MSSGPASPTPTSSGAVHDVPGVTTSAPGTEGYRTATSPQNAAVSQHPAVVASPRNLEEVAVCVRHAGASGLTVVPQATGHGAAAELGDDVLLLDTSGLDSVSIDAAGRTATVGAGCRWGPVDEQAAAAGLLARAGSSPSVGVAGFTFGAGAGWLTRPWGLASGALTAVEYVDGRGVVRWASDDAAEEVDRDVIWACRGGGGVGIVGSLTFDLVPVEQLWAGYLLWPLEALDAVVAAWVGSLGRTGRGLTTSLGVVLAPPSPLVPEHLHGQKVVHLSLASTTGEEEAAVLREALTAAPQPAIDTWGPADVAALGQIHLDPPTAVPGAGIGRWLDDALPGIAADLFQVMAAEDSVVQTEVRHVANDAAVHPGALDTPPGAFMLHAVGSPGSGPDDPLPAALARIAEAARPADTGLAVGSWCDGTPEVPDALPPAVRDRVAAIADRVDPHRVLARSPVITAATLRSGSAPAG